MGQKAKREGIKRGIRDGTTQEALYCVNALMNYCKGDDRLNPQIPMLQKLEREITWIELEPQLKR